MSTLRVISLFILLVIGFAAEAQVTPTVTQRSSNYVLARDKRVKFDSTLIAPVYSDTTKANNSNSHNDSLGMIISIKSHDTLTFYYRDSVHLGTGHRWVKFGTGTGGGGGNTIYTADDALTSDRTVDISQHSLNFKNLDNSVPSSFNVNLGWTAGGTSTQYTQDQGTIAEYSNSSTNIAQLLIAAAGSQLNVHNLANTHKSYIKLFPDSLQFFPDGTTSASNGYILSLLDKTTGRVGWVANSSALQNIFPRNNLTVINDSTFEEGGTLIHHTHVDGSSNYDYFFDSLNLYYTGPFPTLSGDTTNYKLVARSVSTGKLVPMNWNSTAGGGGSLINDGSGYRAAVAGTSHVKTFLANNPIFWDTITSNSLTVKADTSTALTGLVTKAFLTNYTYNSTLGVYNVRDYGAVADGKDILGGMTNGSAVYTATAPTFTSADVGKYIEVFGAGASYGGGSKRLVATIIGFTNSTVVTLSKNASTTVSSARTAYGTDNVTAFQAAVDAAFTGGKGGKVFIPNGYYILAGALNTSYYGENPNAQIAIPVVGTDATTFATRTNILIEGQSIPEWLPASIGVDYGPPRTGVLLKSIIDGTGQMPAVFGSKGFHGELDSINYNFLTMRNMTIIVPPDSAGRGPTMTGINGYFLGSLMCENVLVSIDNSIKTSVLPQNEAAGIITSKKNSEIMSYLSNCLASGFKYAIIASEHCQMSQTVAQGSYAGFVFPENFYTAYGIRLGGYWNVYTIYVPQVMIMGRIPAASNVFFNVASMNSEIFLAAYTPAVWYNNVATVYDPASVGLGTVNAIIVARAQFGTLQKAFVKNGGNNIICSMIGTQYNKIDTVTSRITIGDTTDNSSDLRLNFNNKTNSGAAINIYSEANQLYTWSNSLGATFQGSANATSGAQSVWFDRVNSNYAGGWANSDFWIGRDNTRYTFHSKPANASVVGMNIFASGSVSINQGTETASALFEAASTTKGVLVPRMNTAQQNAISSPATSLLIWNTDTAAFRYYNGSAWVTVASGAAAGTPTLAQVLTSGNVSNSQQQMRLLDYNQILWQLKIGGGMFQAYQRGNFFFQENAYFNGTNYVRDSVGTAQQLQFVSGDLYIKTAGSSTAGSTITWNVPQRIFANNNTMFHQSTGLADNSTALVQIVSSTQSQLALHYDATHHADFTTSSAGDLTIGPSNHVVGFSKAVKFNLTSQSGGTYTISDDDFTVIFTGSTSTWTFPAAVTGKVLHLVNHGTGSITYGTAITTDNGTTTTTRTHGGADIIQYDGSVWRKIGGY